MWNFELIVLPTYTIMWFFEDIREELFPTSFAYRSWGHGCTPIAAGRWGMLLWNDIIKVLGVAKSYKLPWLASIGGCGVWMKLRGSIMTSLVCRERKYKFDLMHKFANRWPTRSKSVFVYIHSPPVYPSWIGKTQYQLTFKHAPSSGEILN